MLVQRKVFHSMMIIEPDHLNQKMVLEYLILVLNVLGLRAETLNLITSGSSNNEAPIFQPGEIDALVQDAFMNTKINDELDPIPHGCSKSEIEAYLNSLLEECGDFKHTKRGLCKVDKRQT